MNAHTSQPIRFAQALGLGRTRSWWGGLVMCAWLVGLCMPGSAVWAGSEAGGGAGSSEAAASEPSAQGDEDASSEAGDRGGAASAAKQAEETDDREAGGPRADGDAGSDTQAGEDGARGQDAQPGPRQFFELALRSLDLTPGQQRRIEVIVVESRDAADSWRRTRQAEIEKLQADFARARSSGDLQMMRRLRVRQREMLSEAPDAHDTARRIVTEVLTSAQRLKLRERLEALRRERRERQAEQTAQKAHPGSHTPRARTQPTTSRDADANEQTQDQTKAHEHAEAATAEE